ncbi:MAG: hypothetical protein E4H13_00445 [Calditrichales bacterium]|nr:MAG: hypothetical protein E4H13_00445 [Calditrichales bacterium]
MKKQPADKSPHSPKLHITIKDFFLAFWKTIVVWIIIGVFIAIALHFEVDKAIIGAVVVVFGLVTQAFIGLIGIIALVPFIGPIIAKVLALPLFWLINALGYFVSILAIKKGFSKDVLNYRVLTIVFLVGIVIGYIIGKFV